MLEEIAHTLREKCKLDPGATVLVGVSGGPDSLCLAGVLRQAGYRIVLAHFNHRLRPEADREAVAVEELAAHWKVPCTVESGAVREHAAAKNLSIEAAARQLRYRFLFETARRQDAQAVAVGHTADDQVETVLMHFIRGAGMNGLKGMSYRTFLPAFDVEIPVVRPLLDVGRDETVAYCAGHDLQPHYDPSNDSPDFLRNRIRHELIPQLEAYNPRVRDAVLRNARALAEDRDLLQDALQIWWESAIMRIDDDFVMFDAPYLSTQSSNLQRHLIRRAVNCLLPDVETDYAMLERATDFLSNADKTQVDLTGGLVLLREQEVLFVTRSGTRLPTEKWPQLPMQLDKVVLSVPDRIQLDGDWTFSSEVWSDPASAWEESSKNRDRFRVWIDAENLPEKLELRVRHRGDVFEPLGLGGHSQKLSDFFTNAKLPQRMRARWPLLSAGDRIIWVPGYRPAEDFKLKPTSKRVACFLCESPEIVRK